MAAPYARSGTGIVITATAPSKILAILVANTNASVTSVVFDDSTDASGDELATISVPASDTAYIDFTDIGGVPFESGVYVTVTGGTAAITVYV